MSRIHPATAPGQRVGPHRVRVRPSTTCTASRPGGAWTRSSSPTSWSSTTSSQDDLYDLWIGDEAWEVDYYLHENPELKRAAYAGSPTSWAGCRCPTAARHEAQLTADYNAEMIEHIARYPRVRDLRCSSATPRTRTDAFGPDLPSIRDWTEEHYGFPGAT